MSKPLVILYSAIFILTALFLLGCESNNAPDENTTHSSLVYAGIYDSTMVFHEFDTALRIEITRDSNNLYGAGQDSIDIDLDGSFDLIIYIYDLNEDSTHLINGMPNPFPNCRMKAKNNLELATYTESYAIGMGQTGTAEYIEMFNMNDSIDSLLNWQTSSLKLWSENPGTAGTPPFGKWYEASSDNYIGIRMSGSRYGWIRVDGSTATEPRFISFALQSVQTTN